MLVVSVYEGLDDIDDIGDVRASSHIARCDLHGREVAAWHTSGKCFFIRNDRKNFIPVTEANLKRMLKGQGLLARGQQGADREPARLLP